MKLVDVLGSAVEGILYIVDNDENGNIYIMTCENVVIINATEGEKWPIRDLHVLPEIIYTSAKCKENLSYDVNMLYEHIMNYDLDNTVINLSKYDCNEILDKINIIKRHFDIIDEDRHFNIIEEKFDLNVFDTPGWYIDKESERQISINIISDILECLKLLKQEEL